MNRADKETRDKMKEMRESGITINEISKILGFSTSTVQYHTSERQKQNTLKRVIANSKIWDGRKDYMKKYMNTRYNNDEEFRERMKKHARESWHRRKNGS